MNQENEPVQYYAAPASGRATPEFPSGVFRYARHVVSDALGPEGKWERNNWFLDEDRGEEVGTDCDAD